MLGWKNTCTETNAHMHTHTPAREDVGMERHMYRGKHTHTYTHTPAREDHVGMERHMHGDNHTRAHAHTR